MKHILFDLFLVSLGAGIGVITMCLVQAGSQFDRDMETWKRGENILNNVFYVLCGESDSDVIQDHFQRIVWIQSLQSVREFHLDFFRQGYFSRFKPADIFSADTSHDRKLILGNAVLRPFFLKIIYPVGIIQ